MIPAVNFKDPGLIQFQTLGYFWPVNRSMGYKQLNSDLIPVEVGE